MAFLCSVLGHARNPGRIRHDGLDFRSRCRRCGIALVRTVDGKWEAAESQKGDDSKLR